MEEMKHEWFLISHFHSLASYLATQKWTYNILLLFLFQLALQNYLSFWTFFKTPHHCRLYIIWHYIYTFISLFFRICNQLCTFSLIFFFMCISFQKIDLKGIQLYPHRNSYSLNSPRVTCNCAFRIWILKVSHHFQKISLFRIFEHGNEPPFLNFF